jgi:Xaa-Pro aminopeptidase
VGIDPLLHGARAVMKIEETLLPKNIVIKAIEKNPIDKIWTENRPLIPDGKLRIHPANFAGKSLDQKLIEIRKILVENEVSNSSHYLQFIFSSYFLFVFSLSCI